MVDVEVEDEASQSQPPPFSQSHDPHRHDEPLGPQPTAITIVKDDAGSSSSDNDDEEDEEAMETSPKPPRSARKPPGRKKKKHPLTLKQRATAEEKLLLLSRTLELHPFIPDPAAQLPDESILRLLGLYDFATAPLERDIRKVLLAELIACYDRPHRRSFVKGARILMARADIARALGLPVKKMGPSELEEKERKLLMEHAPAVVNFLMNWVVLVGDIGIIPEEAQAAIKLIESGQAQKVDWAALVLLMVDRELVDAPKTGFCYYASHLQQLIRQQKPKLFGEAEVEEDDMVMEVPEVDEDEGASAGCTVDVDEHKVQNLEDSIAEKKQGTSFAFDFVAGGAENVEEVGSQEQHDHQQQQHDQHWCLGQKNNVEDHFLQRCTSNIVQTHVMELDDVIEKGHRIENQERREDDFTSKLQSNLDGSNDFLQGMGIGNDSFCPSIQTTAEASSGEFLVSPMGKHKSMPVHFCADGPSLFGNNGKTVSEEIHDDEDENDDEEEGVQHLSDSYPSKRVRLDGQWSQGQSEFETYVDQAMSLMGKAKEMYAHKQHDFMNVQMQVQYLNQLVHQKDQYIQTMERNRLEIEHQKQLELYRFEHERTVMAHMVIGYQKALKETHRAFAEYRNKFGQGVEPLYKDVVGGGGLVLPARELERQRLDKLELEKHRLEMRALENNSIMNTVLEFSSEWSDKFEGYVEQVHQLTRKLKELCEERTFLEGEIASKKCSNETVE